jgi:LuxR family transcriptional regulator, maltose regulon positive regulatory protein
MMFTEILASKVSIPSLRPSLVARPRLIKSLNEGLFLKRKLSLVSAPAGFGKTTLVVDWLRQTGCPAAWLSLEDADNEPQRFLGYVRAALRQADEEISTSLGSALQVPQMLPVEKMMAGLVNEIASRPDPLILVLDDYHVLSDAALLEGMGFLIDHQPHQLHLVLITREDPNLPLARLRARNQLIEIRATDLRFTRAEADTFLRDVMRLTLSDQDVATLEGRTEGWAVGLQLAGLSIQKQANLKSFIAEFSGSHRHILDYLTEEVLQQQPEDIRTFLLQTSILERLSGPLCDALTGRINSHNVLAQLEAENLFIIPLDEERRWYRYHHLFSDLLRNQLTRVHPKMMPELHRRAACWYEDHGEIQDAIDHALKDVDLSRATHLIEQYTFPGLYQGQIAMVVGWYDRLPHKVLESAPMLCIGKAWALALMQRGAHRSEIDMMLEAASQALDRVNAAHEVRDLVAGHAASLRAFLLRSPWTGETRERLIILSREAQRLLPAGEKAIRSINELNIGYAYLGLADLKAARLAFQQAQEDGISGCNFYAAIYGPINLILSALLVGRRREALQLCETNMERFNRMLAGQYFPPIGALYILKGSILLEHNQVADAEQLVTEGLDLIRWTGESVAHRTGYTALARLRAIQGNQPGMLEAVKALEETLPNDTFYAQALRYRLSLCHWPGDSYAQADAQAWLDESGIEFRRLAVISSLNPASTAQFESYLNAAYVMACLAKAMPGAYSLEGVQEYLERQTQFAESHGLLNWVVEVAIVQAEIYQGMGKKEKALETLAGPLRIAAPTGLFQIFVDECETLQSLLEALKPRLKDTSVSAYTNRLLEAFGRGAANAETGEKQEAMLSARELEVLQSLAKGQSYEEIGQQLFLSLNTIQSHVKNIYRKLGVNKRIHAIEKARELNLI